MQAAPSQLTEQRAEPRHRGPLLDVTAARFQQARGGQVRRLSRHDSQRMGFAIDVRLSSLSSVNQRLNAGPLFETQAHVRVRRQKVRLSGTQAPKNL